VVFVPALIGPGLFVDLSDADKPHICLQRWEPKIADKPSLDREKSFRAVPTVTKNVASQPDKGVNVMSLNACTLPQRLCCGGLVKSDMALRHWMAVA
jgi:hypothetical protein